MDAAATTERVCMYVCTFVLLCTHNQRGPGRKQMISPARSIPCLVSSIPPVTHSCPAAADDASQRALRVKHVTQAYEYISRIVLPPVDAFLLSLQQQSKEQQQQYCLSLVC